MPTGVRPEFAWRKRATSERGLFVGQLAAPFDHERRGSQTSQLELAHAARIIRLPHVLIGRWRFTAALRSSRAFAPLIHQADADPYLDGSTAAAAESLDAWWSERFESVAAQLK